MTPLIIIGPSHCSRSQARSSQVAGGVVAHSPYASKNVGAMPPSTTMFGTVRSGKRFFFAQSDSQRGRSATSSEERRVGHACFCPCRSPLFPFYYKTLFFF